MREPKFDVGDVVQLSSICFGKYAGEIAEVVKIDSDAHYWVTVQMMNGKKLSGWEYTFTGISLEEVQRYYADKPRRGFIVDGLTVDELESGQDEAYEMFQRAAKDAEYCERVQKETKEAYNRIRRCKLYRKESDAWDCIVGFAFTTLGETALWIILWLKGYLDWKFSLAGVVFAALMAVYAAHHMVWLIKGINSEIERIDSVVEDGTQQEGEP